MEEGELVLSDVHLHTRHCEERDHGRSVSRFRFWLSQKRVTKHSKTKQSTCKERTTKCESRNSTTYKRTCEDGRRTHENEKKRTDEDLKRIHEDGRRTNEDEKKRTDEDVKRIHEDGRGTIENVKRTDGDVIQTFEDEERSHEDIKRTHEDEDEDLLVSRKRRRQDGDSEESSLFAGSDETGENWFTLTIVHSLATELKDVGEQVWLGSLLLADFIIHYQSMFTDKVVIDLGAGVGISSIIAALFAKEVISTDVGENILHLLQHNMRENLDTLCMGEHGIYKIKELDWTADKLEDNLIDSSIKREFRCSKEDLACILNSNIIIGADVIYDDDLTDSLFRTVYHIMKKPPEKSFYIVFEIRYIFSMFDKDIMSPAYDHFRSCLADLHLCNEEDGVKFDYEEVPVDFPKYFEYKRTKELVCTT